jgi:peptidyl-prolyl cis-trans isomerase C
MFLGILGVTGYAVSLSPGTLRAEEQSMGETKKVVARVNAKPIYEEQLEPSLESSLRKFREHGMRKESPDLVDRLRMKALDKAIGHELIYQESRKLTIENLEEEVDQRLQVMKTKHGSGDRFERSLKARQLTVEDLRESLRARVYIDEYLKREGIAEPAIAEDRIREFYEANPDNYRRKETLEVSHILIKVDADAKPEEKEKARKKADRIRNEIMEGEAFAEMARKHSDCNSAPGGGSLGYIKKGYMPEEFDRIAFAMEEDAVSDAVETKFGYHIIKVSDKKPAGIAPYEEVKDFIQRFLQEEESRKRRQAHITELRERAKIEILLNDSE